MVFAPRFSLALLLVAVAAVAAQSPVQLTEPVRLSRTAQIRGINGPNYQSFMGIPYAEPPLNQLRFAKPQPKPLWNGVFDAVNTVNECIQMNFLVPNPPIEGDEDCLYLNVYRPHRSGPGSHKKLPVMVYIHGGGWFSGTMNPAVYGPRYFMETGEVIVVNIQYRLSTLGFLATGDAAAPGNFGLKDQVLALKWVKENIAAFGGDSDQITLFGQSVGGASVHMHQISPLSKGLFNQGISMSGTSINSWNYPTDNPLALARKHAQVLGIANADTISTTDLVARMREIPAADLISSVTELKFFDVDSLTVYRTVVEPNLPGAFLTDKPKNLLRAGKYEKVPFMLGMVEEEGAVRGAVLVTNQTLAAEMNADINNLLPQILELTLTGTALTNFMTQVFNKYLPGTGTLTSANEGEFIEMYNHRSFEYTHYKALQMIVDRSSHRNPIYTYHFNYRGQYSYSPFFTNSARDFGVVHCDDLIYLFESPAYFPSGLNAADKAMSRKYVDLYVKFAKGQSPWRKTGRRGRDFGPYLSLPANTLNYYNDWDMVAFWDQAQEF